ncbi:cysteine hydrolase family protein [Thermogemmatispora sp.]|uniref:cysteine hydrolase family protein n=1 Tax=Thermogemmatispora sp. TaxID=1968838 RepID=UPI001D2F8645|nr:cysteine hydrolase [Thermogemmatispora sp.]MBX5450861.1 cysteine hydrolase [Thermogemmatispora sp.]
MSFMDHYTRPDFASVALIVLEMQRDFLEGQPAGMIGTSAILPRIVRLLQAFRAAERPIVHVVRLYLADGSNVDLCYRGAVEQGAYWVLAGSPGSEIVPELLPDRFSRLETERLLSGHIQYLWPGEVIIYKPRWGAFYGTPLENYLRRARVSTLAICGCNFPHCLRSTLYEASERDFRLVLVEDAVSGLYEQGKQELRAIGVSLMDSAEVVAHLERGRASSDRAAVKGQGASEDGSGASAEAEG